MNKFALKVGYEAIIIDKAVDSYKQHLHSIEDNVVLSNGEKIPLFKVNTLEEVKELDNYMDENLYSCLRLDPKLGYWVTRREAPKLFGNFN